MTAYFGPLFYFSSGIPCEKHGFSRVIIGRNRLGMVPLYLVAGKFNKSVIFFALYLMYLLLNIS